MVHPLLLLPQQSTVLFAALLSMVTESARRGRLQFLFK